MLPLFQEYQVDHFRFKEHHRIAIIMALVAPVCALVLYQQLDWWNPWLWGCGGIGLALALALHSVVMVIKNPHYQSTFSKHFADTSHEWFPFFFVVLQSSIASLIIMFVWFSITALALTVPLYVHALLITLAVVLPIRRYFWAKTAVSPPPAYEKTNEILHGTSHIIASIFIARCIIAFTVSETDSQQTSTVFRQIIVWIPAGIYMLYTAISMIYHLLHDKETTEKVSPSRKTTNEEPLDRF